MNYYPFLAHSPTYSQKNYFSCFDVYKNLEEMNELLDRRNIEMEILRQQNQNLKQSIVKLQEKLQNEIKKSKQTRKITKNYYRKNACAGPDKNSRIYCPYGDCHHHYSSTLALNFHIKSKHKGGNKKQRQAYAKIIVQAQLKGEEPPKINFNFPPEFLEKYRHNFLKAKKNTDFTKKSIQNQNSLQDQNMKTQ